MGHNGTMLVGPGANRPPLSRVTAVVPAHNEAARIAVTVSELRHHVDEVVVVDDRSEDGTGEAARRAGARVIRNVVRLGYVGAVKRGFAAASGSIVVTVDADGEMPVERIAELIAPIVAGHADMVQGHRSHVPRLSERLVSCIAGIGAPVGDSGTGFRALTTKLARDLEIPGTCICGSLALEASARGARVVEIRVVTRPLGDRRRRVAWSHVGQAVLVARMAVRLRARRIRRRRVRRLRAPQRTPRPR